MVPLSFVSDHIETLYEVDMLFADEANAAGITDYRRPEALNTHPLFIESLARQVERHLERIRRTSHAPGCPGRSLCRQAR